jgi:hypothetical protein
MSLFTLLMLHSAHKLMFTLEKRELLQNKTFYCTVWMLTREYIPSMTKTAAINSTFSFSDAYCPLYYIGELPFFMGTLRTLATVPVLLSRCLSSWSPSWYFYYKHDSAIRLCCNITTSQAFKSQDNTIGNIEQQIRPTLLLIKQNARSRSRSFIPKHFQRHKLWSWCLEKNREWLHGLPIPFNVQIWTLLLSLPSYLLFIMGPRTVMFLVKVINEQL